MISLLSTTLLLRITIEGYNFKGVVTNGIIDQLMVEVNQKGWMDLQGHRRKQIKDQARKELEKWKG